MRSGFVTVIVLFLALHCCANSSCPQQDSTKTSADQEIRSAVCEFDSGDVASAEMRLEKVLLSDPTNINAQRLLLGIKVRQVKPGDTSPGNIALARKAIEASRRALNSPQFSSKEKAAIDRRILVLYGDISQEEQTNELLKHVSDSNRSLVERAEFYTILASNSWNCSFEITDLSSNKMHAMKNNKLEVFYKMPKDPKDFQTARTCVTRGLEEIENAIKFDPNSESAWSYKTNLLNEAAKLAEMENNPAQKASYKNQAGEAQKRTMEIDARLEKEREEKWKKDDEEERKSEQTWHKQSTNNQPDDDAQLSKELTEYKAENSLDNLIEEYSDPGDVTTLVAPVPIAPDPTAPESSDTTTKSEPIPQPTPKGCFREVDGQAQVMEKRDWKSFSPANEDFTVDLPDNLCPGERGYIAASEGVTYSIFVLAPPSLPVDPTVVDGVLNTLARTFVGFRSRTWMGGANTFEVRILRKDFFNGRPGKFYAYALISCSTHKDGVLIVYAGKTHYYTVDISGANELDQRVQRFLKSVKFK